MRKIDWICRSTDESYERVRNVTRMDPARHSLDPGSGAI